MKENPENRIEALVVKSAEWLRAHHRVVLSAAGIAALLVAITVAAVSRHRLGTLRASEKFSSAQGMTSQGMTEQATGLLNEIISQYPNSVAASQSRLLLAEIYVRQKKYEEAEILARAVYESGSPKSMRPFALYMLSVARCEKGDVSGGRADCMLFIEKYPDHFLAPRVYERIGWLYESALMPADARQIYERMSMLYPSSVWAERAAARIKSLSAPEQK